MDLNGEKILREDNLLNKDVGMESLPDLNEIGDVEKSSDANSKVETDSVDILLDPKTLPLVKKDVQPVGGDGNTTGVLDIEALKSELEGILSRAAKRAAQNKELVLHSKESFEECTSSEEKESVSVSESEEEVEIQEIDSKNIVEEASHLSFNNTDLLETFPNIFTNQQTAFFPEVVFCPNLSSLEFCVSNISNLFYYKQTNPVDDEYFRSRSGSRQIVFEQELRLRERISSVLRSLKCPQISHFLLINDDDGEGRLEYLEKDLRDFLNLHSSTLDKISIRSTLPPKMPKTVVSFTETNMIPEIFPVEDFPKLEELELVLWKESQIVMKKYPEFNSYWVHMLQNSTAVRKLRKFVWCTSQPILWNEVLRPVLKHCRRTLETVHVICTDDLIRHKRSTDMTYFSCTHFANLHNLQSLYLRDLSHPTMLLELSALPTTLTELSLDGVCFRSYDLEETIGKLTKLNKLRLVSNGRKRKKSNIIMKQDYSKNISGFGVDEFLIKSILKHRTLNNVYLWEIDMENYASIKMKKKHKSWFEKLNFQTLRNWILSSPYSWKTKVDAGTSSGAPCLSEILQKVGKIDKNTIRIGIDKKDNANVVEC